MVTGSHVDICVYRLSDVGFWILEIKAEFYTQWDFIVVFEGLCGNKRDVGVGQ